jgi:hypothetical protein
MRCRARGMVGEEGGAMKLIALSAALVSAGLAFGCGTKAPSNGPDAPVATTDAGAADAAPPQLVTIGLGTPVCEGQGKADPSKGADVGPVIPDEIGDPALARITPPSYPFKVTSISYRLTGQQTTCGTNIAHAVSVFAAPSADPVPPTPANVQRIAVAAPATDEATMVITQPLPTPIVLTQGQDLFVAVEMDVNPTKTVAICLDGCIIPGDDHRNFWSEQPQPPHTWDSLYSFGIQVDYAIWAQGVPQ